MSAESLFGPISTDLIRQARGRLALEGLSVEDWARREGHKAKTVYSVLSGERMAIRGESFRIAVKLGLRPDPNAEEHRLPSDVRSVPLIGKVGACERPPKLQARERGTQLGEPVR